MQNASPKSVGRLLDAIDRTNDIVEQFVAVIGATVGKILFGLCPDAFVGIQIRRIGRQVFQMQTRMLIENVLDGPAFVGGGIVQQDNNGTPEMAQQLSQEEGHFIMANVVEEEKVVQTQSLAPGAH